MRALAAGVCLLVLCACGPALAGRQPADRDEDACRTGRVARMGVEGLGPVVLRTEDGREPIVLEGAEVSLLSRISNAVVRVCGERDERRGSLEVRSFELREVDGLPALLGRLRTHGGGYALEPEGDQPAVGLVAVPPFLSGREGARIWVAGAWEGERFRVQSFGVLEPE